MRVDMAGKTASRPKRASRLDQRRTSSLLDVFRRLFRAIPYIERGSEDMALFIRVQCVKNRFLLCVFSSS